MVTAILYLLTEFFNPGRYFRPRGAEAVHLFPGGRHFSGNQLLLMHGLLTLAVQYEEGDHRDQDNPQRRKLRSALQPRFFPCAGCELLFRFAGPRAGYGQSAQAAYRCRPLDGIVQV